MVGWMKKESSENSLGGGGGVESKFKKCLLIFYSFNLNFIWDPKIKRLLMFIGVLGFFELLLCETLSRNEFFGVWFL